MYAQMCLEGHGCLIYLHLKRWNTDLLRLEVHFSCVRVELRKYWSVPIDKSKLKNDFFYCETDQEESRGVSA